MINYLKGFWGIFDTHLMFDSNYIKGAGLRSKIEKVIHNIIVSIWRKPLCLLQSIIFARSIKDGKELFDSKNDSGIFK